MEANLLRQLISANPAELLIASVWQGLLLTALAWAGLKLVPRLRAATRFTVWSIVFLIVALLPCFAVCHQLFGARPGQFPTPSMAPADISLHLNIGWAFVIEGLWALASLFSLARLSAGVHQMRTLSRNSTPVPFPELGEEIQAIVASPGSRPVEVRLSDRVDAPSVIGFFQPAIVMPRSLWSALAPSELKQIILHEMAHLDRRDDWTNLLQKLLRALCPLNPALFWAERHLCLERERACDDAVLDAAGNARAYATCLTKLAETKLVRRTTSLAPGMWKRRSELAGRVESILDRRRNLSPLLSRGLVAASLVLSLTGVAALQRCPGIITFAPGDSVATEARALRPVSAGTFERAAYQSRYQDQHQARYQEAVYHPPLNPAKTSERPVTTGSRPALAAKRVAANPRDAYPAGRLRFLELRSTDEDGEGVTWILFTVEAPRPANITVLDGDSSPAQSPTVSSSQNWIVFQI